MYNGENYKMPTILILKIEYWNHGSPTLRTTQYHLYGIPTQ